MDSNLIAAFVGAVVSALIAWFTARHEARSEVDKLRNEANNVTFGAHQQLLEQLVTARLQVYPALYMLLSGFLKAEGGCNGSALRQLLSDVNEWDSKNGCLLGPRTTNVCDAFRRALIEAVSDPDRSSAMDTLRRNTQLLELGLRSDLGIYGVKRALDGASVQLPGVTSYDLADESHATVPAEPINARRGG